MPRKPFSARAVAARGFADWRTARQRRRQAGPAVCRSGRKNNEPAAGAGGHRSRESLRDECPQTFQVGASRKAPHPQKTERPRNCGVPPLARCGNRSGQAKSDRVSRRNGCAGTSGRGFRVTQHGGEFAASPLAPYVMATIHPSAILRAPDEETRHQQEQRFVADMKRVAKLKL